MPFRLEGWAASNPDILGDVLRILVVEDDREAARYLKKGLQESGFNVTITADGEEGLILARKGGFDCLIIDRMLPGMDGLQILETIRKQEDATPVLILSALNQVKDRVEGLKRGADDYLVKPFAFSELLARIEALMRRANSEQADTSLKVGSLEMDYLTRIVTVDGVPVELQAREFQLLNYLMRHAGQVVTRTMLLENVWEYTFDPQTNVVDVHISRLRKKLDPEGSRRHIETVRGAGYRLVARA